jgi:PAS domain S-box-containing protein
MTAERSRTELAAELEELRSRLAEAQEALRTIRSGGVDALVVPGEGGEQVYTLSGADRAYRQLIETMSQGAATLSADGVILYANARLAEILGRPLETIMGTALRDFLPPDAPRALDAMFPRGGGEPRHQEAELIGSEGRRVPVYLSASRLLSDGVPLTFCLVLTDLTEQRSHEKVVATERLARLILEQAAEAIIVCDQEGKVIRASRAAQILCDGGPSLRPFAEACPLRSDATGPFLLEPVLRGETLKNVDVALARPGKHFDLILNAGPLRSGHEILGCVVTLTDITERKEAERRVESRLEELRRWEEVMLHREDRIQELKREVNDLCRRVGEEVHYPSQDAGSKRAEPEKPSR